MHITKVVTDGFNGITRSYNVTLLTIFTGDHGEGKTTLLNAIRFAVRGITPAGKRNEDLWLHAKNGATRISVSIELSDGTRWTRALHKNNDTGVITSTLVIAGHEALKPLKAEKELAAKLGRFDAQWDLFEFHDLTPQAKRAYVSKLCGNLGNTDGLEDRVRLGVAVQAKSQATVDTMAYDRFGVKAGALEGSQISIVAEAVLDTCDEEWRTALDGVLEETDKVIEQGRLSESIAAMLGAANGEKLAQNKIHTDAVKAGHTFADQQAEIQAVAGHLDEVEKELHNAREGLVEIRESVARAEGLKQSRDDLASEQAKAEQKVAVLRDMDFDDLAQASVQADEELAQAQADLQDQQLQVDEAAAGIVQAGRAVKEAEDAKQQQADRMKAAFAEATKASTNVSNMTLDGAALERQIEARKGDPWVKALELFNNLPQHPDHLGDETYEELDALMTKQADPYTTVKLRADLELLRGNFGLAEDESEALKSNAMAAEQASHETNATLKRCAEIARNVAEAQRIENTKLNRLQNLSTSKHTAAAAATQDAQGLSARRAEAEERVIELQARITALPTSDLAALMEQRSGLEEQVRGLKGQKTAHEDQRARARNLADAQARAAKAMLAFDAAEKAEAAVRALRETIMAEAISPLTGGMDDVVRHAYPTDKEFDRVYCDLVTDRGKAIFEMGVMVGGDQVAWQVLSGAQRAVFDAALLAVLIKKGGSVLPTLCLELDSMRPDAAKTFLEAIATVDAQVLCCTWNEEVVAPGWDVVLVGQEEACSS